MAKKAKIKKVIVNPNEINPIDFYNRNHIQDAFNIMVTKQGIERNGLDAFTFVKNKSDKKKKMVVIEDGNFIAKMENGLGMKIGEPYTPFMMVQKFKFKGNFKLTLSYVIYEIMINKVDYIRVGIKYFKRIKKIDRNDIVRTEIKIWDRPTIINDHGKDFVEKIEVFDDFTISPDNKEYREIVDNNYNLYSPFEHDTQSKSKYKGELGWYWTNTLLKHIFGNQYDLGIKYIKTMYDLPKQKLPILVLVSEERGTGKTTFIDWVELLFGANSVIINPQDISNQFNGSYADKNIIMIEESRFDGKQAMEKLKNLSTQKKILVNSKFIQQYSLPFHGKLIITSNDENKFSRIDQPEIRYWIRKVPSLENIANHNILNDMRKEIPSFLYYISTLKDINVLESRMVFKAEDIKTEALEQVKKESRTSLFKEIEILLEEHFLQNPQIEKLMFSLVDIKNEWFNHDVRIDRPFIRSVLRDEFKIEPTSAKRYIPFQTTLNTLANQKTGRPYVFKNPYYGKDTIL